MDAEPVLIAGTHRRPDARARRQADVSGAQLIGQEQDAVAEETTEREIGELRQWQQEVCMGKKQDRRGPS